LIEPRDLLFELKEEIPELKKIENKLSFEIEDLAKVRKTIKKFNFKEKLRIEREWLVRKYDLDIIKATEGRLNDNIECVLDVINKAYNFLTEDGLIKISNIIDNIINKIKTKIMLHEKFIEKNDIVDELDKAYSDWNASKNKI